MRCERAQEWMTADLDGALSSWRRRVLTRHLARCAACAAERGRPERLFAALAALPREAAVSERL